jgi:hypothetical protein
MTEIRAKDHPAHLQREAGQAKKMAEKNGNHEVGRKSAPG